MRTLQCGTLEIPDRINTLQEKHWHVLRERLTRKYGQAEHLFRDIFQLPSRYFADILTITNGNLRNKRILDLGCGSVDSPDAPYGDKRKERMFEPWLCRGLHELGTQVLGVDLGNLSGEEFLGRSLDLRRPDVLRFIQPHSVELITAFQFFSSPVIRSYRKEIWEQLLPEINTLLKPNGTFLYHLEGGLGIN